ncbi:MAG: segregation and condensation protein A [Sphingomonadales bacterium]
MDGVDRGHGASVFPPGQLVVNLDGYEGPLDVLLVLARSQKVDLKQISIRDLAEQYLTFVSEAARLRLNLAADYLVMAAWLAYLKSRLLLPEEEDEEEPSAQEMAARLTFQLQRLEAMRERAAQLMSRHRLGRDVFARGGPEGVAISRRSSYDATLYELLKAYAVNRTKGETTAFHIERPPIFSIEEALTRLSGLVGKALEWTRLETFLPPITADSGPMRSAIASTFVASLEIARRGDLELKQLSTFGPIFLRKKSGGP